MGGCEKRCATVDAGSVRAASVHEVNPFFGRTALITGAARGQGRNHAIALAEAGCNILAVDLCAQIPSVAYDMPTRSDLDDTMDQVARHTVRCYWRPADVRNISTLTDALSGGMYGMGIPALDYLVCNAGIGPVIGEQANTRKAFTDCLDVMVTGVHNTITAALPWMRGGGAIVITGSTAARKSLCPNVASMSHGLAGYHAAKAACVGLMRYYATALAERNIRVNIVHPCGVNTPMTVNPQATKHYLEHPDRLGPVRNLLPDVDLINPADVTDAVLYLLGQRATTGTELMVDAGCTAN